MAAQAWVGTSGWNYKHWAEGVFYPPGLKPDAWLGFYSRYFGTVEVNFSFYRLPEKSSFERWRATVPEGFCFTVKASRFVTHMKRLLEPERSMEKLLQNAAWLEEKRGPFLFQLPPRFRYERERLIGLLDYVRSQQILPNLRAALEVRDQSWYTPDCFQILRDHNTALVIAEQPGFAADAPLTADFVFVRRHGPGGLFGANYPEDALARDADRIREWLAGGREVFIYFNNDPGGNAVRNALRLKELLGQPAGPISSERLFPG